MLDRRVGQAGLALAVLGAALLASSTFGLATLTADRGVTVGVQADPNGLIGVYDVSGTSNGEKGRETVYELTDNGDVVGSAYDLDATVTGFDGALTSSDLDGSVTTGGREYQVEVQCAADASGQGTGNVNLRIENSGSVPVTLYRTTDSRVTLNCNGNTDGSGFTSVSATDVQSGGTQTFSFSPSRKIKSGETVTIDLSQVAEVDYSQATAEPRDNQLSAGFVDSETIEVTVTGGNVKSGDTVYIDVDGYQIDDTTDGENRVIFIDDQTGDSDSTTFETN